MFDIFKKANKNKIFMYSFIFLFIIVLILFLIFLLYPIIKNVFIDNFNGSGYGLNNNFGKITTIIPFNEISKSTDFKLLSLMSQIRFSMVKPPYSLKITNTNEGIINKTPSKNSNIILFPGLTDFILKQNGREVWPKQFNNINNDESAIVYDNNNGHFNTIITLLENLNYINGDRLNTVKGDFRNVNYDEIYNEFISYLKPNTVIIAYDFGCVIANIFINKLKKESNDSLKYNFIKKFIMICPTIGGTPMTLRDYFSGNGIIEPKIIENYDAILMSMPNENFYDKPVAIYNSISYKANNINELMKYNQKSKNTINLFNNIVKKQELSFENPGVDCIIIASQQFNTPIAYNFKNNLSENPERYLQTNFNQTPNDDIHYNGTLEGLQTMGDRIVPINSILKLRELWNNYDNVINIELIKDKDHFTILKSYELALIILANL